jgi:hypothetical protein
MNEWKNDMYKIVTVSNFNYIQINILNQKYILTIDNTVKEW